MKKALITLAGILALALIYLLTISYQTVEKSATLTFHLDVPFKKVRKALNQKESLEKIISMSQGEFIGQEWDEKNFKLLKLRPLNWEADFQGRLVVRSRDENLGNKILVFDQKVRATPNSIITSTALSEPVGPLQDHHTTVYCTEDEERTLFVVTSTIVYKKKIPAMFLEEMERIVQESATKSVNSTYRALSDVILSK